MKCTCNIYEIMIFHVIIGCKWGNRCFKRGETMTKDCLTYKCSVNINPSNTIHRGMRLEERGMLVVHRGRGDYR